MEHDIVKLNNDIAQLTKERLNDKNKYEEELAGRRKKEVEQSETIRKLKIKNEDLRRDLDREIGQNRRYLDDIDWYRKNRSHDEPHYDNIKKAHEHEVSGLRKELGDLRNSVCRMRAERDKMKKELYCSEKYQQQLSDENKVLFDLCGKLKTTLKKYSEEGSTEKKSDTRKCRTDDEQSNESTQGTSSKGNAPKSKNQEDKADIGGETQTLGNPVEKGGSENTSSEKEEQVDDVGEEADIKYTETEGDSWSKDEELQPKEVESEKAGSEKGEHGNDAEDKTDIEFTEKEGDSCSKNEELQTKESRSPTFRKTRGMKQDVNSEENSNGKNSVLIDSDEEFADKGFEVEGFEVINFAQVNDCLSKKAIMPEIRRSDGFDPKICAFNDRINFIAIRSYTIKNKFHDTSCGLSPLCNIKWRVGTMIGEALILEGQTHQNSGKNRWLCAHHVEASIKGSVLQIQKISKKNRGIRKIEPRDFGKTDEDFNDRRKVKAGGDNGNVSVDRDKEKNTGTVENKSVETEAKKSISVKTVGGNSDHGNDAKREDRRRRATELSEQYRNGSKRKSERRSRLGEKEEAKRKKSKNENCLIEDKKKSEKSNQREDKKKLLRELEKEVERLRKKEEERREEKKKESTGMEKTESEVGADGDTTRGENHSM